MPDREESMYLLKYSATMGGHVLPFGLPILHLFAVAIITSHSRKIEKPVKTRVLVCQATEHRLCFPIDKEMCDSLALSRTVSQTLRNSVYYHFI